MFRSRTAQIILAAGSAFTLITATAGDRAHGEGNLDASYMISFARIPVGEITATAVFGESEYAMSARARAGGVLKALLVDGEASFSTQGTIKGGHPVPTTFISKIVSKHRNLGRDDGPRRRECEGAGGHTAAEFGSRASGQL